MEAARMDISYIVFHLGTQGFREARSLFVANDRVVYQIMMPSKRHLEEHLICCTFLKAVNLFYPLHLLIFLRLRLINVKH